MPQLSEAWHRSKGSDVAQHGLVQVQVQRMTQQCSVRPVRDWHSTARYSPAWYSPAQPGPGRTPAPPRLRTTRPGVPRAAGRGRFRPAPAAAVAEAEVGAAVEAVAVAALLPPAAPRGPAPAMSAQAQMRALLDQLMGTARDGE